MAFAVGFAPGVPLVVQVFDFVPEGAGAGLSDEEGTVLGAVQAGGGPGVVGDGEVFERWSVLGSADIGEGDGQQEPQVIFVEGLARSQVSAAGVAPDAV